MNWKKLLLFATGSGLVGGISPWLQSFTSGHAIPFTLGTVGVPALVTLAGTLTALFTNPPHKDQP